MATKTLELDTVPGYMNYSNISLMHQLQLIRTIPAKTQACNGYDKNPHNIRRYPEYIGRKKKQVSNT